MYEETKELLQQFSDKLNDLVNEKGYFYASEAYDILNELLGINPEVNTFKTDIGYVNIDEKEVLSWQQ